jgi:hypothetical protein
LPDVRGTTLANRPAFERREVGTADFRQRAFSKRVNRNWPLRFSGRLEIELFSPNLSTPEENRVAGQEFLLIQFVYGFPGSGRGSAIIRVAAVFRVYIICRRSGWEKRRHAEREKQYAHSHCLPHTSSFFSLNHFYFVSKEETTVEKKLSGALG